MKLRTGMGLENEIEIGNEYEKKSARGTLAGMQQG
jgi:hypothetical protein